MTPFKGTNRVTSIYGMRTSPITGRSEMHRGQDIVTTGDWSVRECTGGTVIKISYDNSRGKYVDVKTSPNTFERYQHMDSIRVSVGQAVLQGTVLGQAGSTGAVTGRHLHFGVYRNGSAEANSIDPSEWSGIPNRVGTYPGNENIDGESQPETPNNKLVYIKVGPLSKGDAKKLEDYVISEQIQTADNGVKIEVSE